MKRYIADKLFLLMIGLGMIIVCPFVFSNLMAWIGIVAICISWFYLCRPILLLPIDLILGPHIKHLTLTNYNYDHGDLFRHHYFAMGFAREANGNKIWLIFPEMVAFNDLENVMIKYKGGKRITYYPLSKIVIHVN